MVIPPMQEVTTSKERTALSDVRWGRRSYHKGRPPLLGSTAMLTGLWINGGIGGCSLLTSETLLTGDIIWLEARDNGGKLVYSGVAIITWSENCFRTEGHRSEARLVALAPDAPNNARQITRYLDDIAV